METIEAIVSGDTSYPTTKQVEFLLAAGIPFQRIKYLSRRMASRLVAAEIERRREKHRQNLLRIRTAPARAFIAAEIWKKKLGLS